VTNGIPTGTQFHIDFCVHEIAKRDYPPVYVVERGSEEDRFLAEWEYQGLTDRERTELAKGLGITVLDGLEVIQNLKGEIDPDDKWVLEDLVMHIFAAKVGRVSMPDTDPERLALAGGKGEDTRARKMVNVEELVQKDVEAWSFIEELEVLASDHPRSFTIPRSPRVEAYITLGNG
jgi:hypothetical protein